MSNYDQWLTTDTAGDAAEAYAERLYDVWQEYAEDHHLPIAIGETDHPDHAIFVAWEALFHAEEAYFDRLLAAEEWAAVEEAEHEEQIEAIRAEEQMVLDSQKEAHLLDLVDRYIPNDSAARESIERLQAERRGLKILHCVVCGVPMKVIPSAERAWCKNHA